MIKIGDVEYRNVQEQVAKNATDIEDLKGGVDNLGEALADEKDAREDADAGLTQDILTLQDAKQDKLTAGTGISISNNVISSTASGGVKLYRHSINVASGGWNGLIAFISVNGTPCSSSSLAASAFQRGFAGQIDGQNMTGMALMLGLYDYYGEGFYVALLDGFYLGTGSSVSTKTISFGDPSSAVLTDTVTEL